MSAAAGGPPRMLAGKLARAFVECGPQASAYGACVVKNLDGLKQGVCGAEMKALRACADRFVRSGKAAGR